MIALASREQLQLQQLLQLLVWLSVSERGTPRISRAKNNTLLVVIPDGPV